MINESMLEGSRIEGSKTVSRYRREHAQAVTLLAPQLNRLISAENSLLPVFDAVDLHARAAARWAMGNDPATGLPAANCLLDQR